MEYSLVIQRQLKRCVLSLLWNVGNDDEFIMSAGSRLQTDGEADRTARAPMTIFVRGTDNVPSPVDPSIFLSIHTVTLFAATSDCQLEIFSERSNVPTCMQNVDYFLILKTKTTS